MQFIVFAAFAIVLSVPDRGPPWLSMPNGGPAWLPRHSQLWMGLIVVGQVLLAGIMGAIASWQVKRRLDRDPAWLSRAQQQLGRWTSAIRYVLIGTFAVSVYLTDWSVYVRGRGPESLAAVRSVSPRTSPQGAAAASQARGKDEQVRGTGFPREQIRGKGLPLEQAAHGWWRQIWGLDELVMLLPFLVAAVVSWITLYPGDRAVRQVSLEVRLWAAQPGRPVWGLWSYLVFMFRHNVLIILAPMLPIVVAIDAVNPDRYGRWLRHATGVVWADQAVIVAVAGAVFLLAPLFLRYIWQTQTLPAGDLRERLDGMCRRIGLRFRDILIWQSDGMVVNAAVMGLTRQVRYVLLSDGLLEMMDDAKIEAVFGHEAGHVKKHHITFYLFFAVFSMLLVGGISELVLWQPVSRLMIRDWHVIQSPEQLRDYLQVVAMGLIVAIWGIGFGPVSRRFEWQADLFGAESVTPDIHNCDHPCLLHGTFGDGAGPLEPGGQGKPAVCATAAHLFGEALYRIAVLNGIPVEARSWRHSSIANRIRLLKSYAVDPSAVARLNRGVLAIKLVLVVGTVVGCAIGAWLYWPAELVHRLLKH